MELGLVKLRNAVEGAVYARVLKPAFFRQDPEKVHDRVAGFSEWLGSNAVTRGLTRLAFDYANPVLEQDILGLHFPNPVGLSAGFDKNARQVQAMPAFGFGFMEIGSVTGEPCAGNPKPRLWRLPDSKSLVVNYGLLNDGAEVVSKRLAGRQFAIPVGINIAKTNCAETSETGAGVADYVKAYRAFAGVGAYYTVNISCPNAFGGQPFTDAGRLERLLSAIDREPHTKPVLVKLSPDLSEHETGALVAVAMAHDVQGFVCSNLTKPRNHLIKDKNIPAAGGISGKVQQPLSDEQVRRVYRQTGGKYLVVGVGGVFTAEDAYRKIRAGASLVELITGMIFQGPQSVSAINVGLVKLLKRDGFKNVSEAVGADEARSDLQRPTGAA